MLLIYYNGCMIKETLPSLTQTATLGGGCFWCIEAVFKQIKGVTKITSGYAGGSTKDPSYEEVCTGSTGHAEVIQITFDPTVIKYSEILELFFAMHDPTTLNRQGNDVGSQYRSIILYHSDEQKTVAENYLNQLTQEQIFDNPIVTEIEPFTEFYRAEEYHQNYFEKNPDQAYCQLVITPKLQKLRQNFQKKLKNN